VLVNRETADDGEPIPLVVKIGALEHVLKLTSTTPLRNWATPPASSTRCCASSKGARTVVWGGFFLFFVVRISHRGLNASSDSLTNKKSIAPVSFSAYLPAHEHSTPTQKSTFHVPAHDHSPPTHSNTGHKPARTRFQASTT
jgi:hypothetical protein